MVRLQPEAMRGYLWNSGVPSDELDKFRQVWNKLHQDPRVPHRFADQSRCAFTLDPEQTHGVSAEPRIIQQANHPWALGTADIVGDLVEKSGNYTSLDDAVGNGQTWCETPVVRALNNLMAKMIDSRPGSGCFSPPDCEQSNTYLMNMFAARVFRDEENCGHPSPEGVHSDGNALTAMMFLGRDNVLPGTGTNRVFDNMMNLGSYDDFEFQRPGGLRDQHLIAETAFDTPFETVIILDRCVRHEGRPIQQAQLNRPAHRDMYLMFLRAPKCDGSDRITLGCDE